MPHRSANTAVRIVFWVLLVALAACVLAAPIVQSAERSKRSGNDGAEDLSQSLQQYLADEAATSHSNEQNGRALDPLPLLLINPDDNDGPVVAIPCVLGDAATCDHASRRMSAQSASDGTVGDYIVTFQDGASKESQEKVMADISAAGGTVKRQFTIGSFAGFSASIPDGQLTTLKADSSVKYLEADGVVTTAARKLGIAK